MIYIRSKCGQKLFHCCWNVLFQTEEGPAGEAAGGAAVLRRAGAEAVGAGEGGGGDAAEPVERRAEGDEGPATQDGTLRAQPETQVLSTTHIGSVQGTLRVREPKNERAQYRG